MFLVMLFWLAYVGYGLFGAVSVLQGEDFRYVFVGPWLERYLEQAVEIKLSSLWALDHTQYLLYNNN